MKTLQILAVLATVTMIGSVVATLMPQQASAVVVIGGKDFKELSKQFQSDVLNIFAVSPPEPDANRQLADLFDDYEAETFRIFEQSPPEPD